MFLNSRHHKASAGDGFAMLAVLLMLTVILSLLGAYTKISRIELASTSYSGNSMKGFYAAEAGLNLRAEEIRQVFLGYNRPSGTSPTSGGECIAGNDGSGDFECSTIDIGKRTADTFVIEEPGNPIALTVPLGELYQNLSAQEYRYTVVSQGKNRRGDIEAILELRFKSRLVPMFQFAAFYNKDLEILPGPLMELAGPVHTNGDLYLNAGNQLDIDGQVTTAGGLWRGRKNNNSCSPNPIRVMDPVSWLSILPGCSTRTELLPTDLTPWNGMIERDVLPVDVPSPEVLDPTPGEVYWDMADIRLVLRLDSSNNPILSGSATGVEIRRADNNANITGATANLDACSGTVNGRPIGYSDTFYNNREGKTIHMLEVDLVGFFDCVQDTINGGGGGQILWQDRQLDDSTEGGLVLYLTVEGPNSADASSAYGVRIRDAGELQSTIGGAAIVQGVTIVSDQAVYLRGDFNAVNKIPAAVLADAFNVLSNVWPLDDSTDQLSVGSRVASNTTVHAGILAGTDTTGGVEGASGQGGNYNGGLENYPRFHEKWSGRTLTYYGSFVSLGNSRHSNGAWSYGNPQYTAPNRDWHYDTDFNNASNLPPLTPRFVYLRQELFLRNFEQ